MFVSDLFEAQRYPRTGLMQKLALHKDDPTIHVTFQQHLKLGINPDSQWEDPVGIYTYPVREMMLGKTAKNGMLVPFAENRHYAYIVKATGNMLELQDYSLDQLDEDMATIQNQFWDQFMAQPRHLHDLWNGVTVEDPRADFEESLVDWLNRWSSHPGAAFWNITDRMSSYIERRSYPDRAKRMIWHKLIRACGYDGVVDRGQAIMHPNEPAQAVILHTGALTVLEAVPNDLFRQLPPEA